MNSCKTCRYYTEPNCGDVSCSWIQESKKKIPCWLQPYFKRKGDPVFLMYDPLLLGMGDCPTWKSRKKFSLKSLLGEK